VLPSAKGKLTEKRRAD
jgi:hypothetical protein